MLLDSGHQQLLQNMILNSERTKTVMIQSEVGETISEMTITTYVKYMDHYKYLVKNGKIKCLNVWQSICEGTANNTKTDTDICDKAVSMAHNHGICMGQNERN